MKEIILKHGQRVLVDDQDYESLIKYKWHGGKYVTCPIIKDGKVVLRIKMHRVIMNCTDPNLEVDHKNHNGLDNRRCNLRVCSSGENTSNRRPWKNKMSTKYMGIHKRGDWWVASIGKYGKVYYLGRFKAEKEAALAYNEAAKRLHGEFANLNVIIN